MLPQTDPQVAEALRGRVPIFQVHHVVLPQAGSPALARIER